MAVLDHVGLILKAPLPSADNTGWLLKALLARLLALFKLQLPGSVTVYRLISLPGLKPLPVISTFVPGCPCGVLPSGIASVTVAFVACGVGVSSLTICGLAQVVVGAKRTAQSRTPVRPQNKVLRVLINVLNTLNAS